MNNELHKRLEEAAKKYADEKFPGHRASENNRRAREDYQLCRDSHIAGIEYGYKEAIAQAKEWLKSHLPTPDWYASLDEFISDFEAGMSKLWEGENDKS